MIPSKYVKNTKVASPILNLLVDAPYIDKMPIKVIYPQWQGENMEQIAEKHDDNPYRIRIGTPNTDKDMQRDHMYFIQGYLSYNPLTKAIEKRELISYRNTQKVYIGEQTVDELSIKNYVMYANGAVAVKDVILIDTQQSLVDTIAKLTSQVAYLRSEIAKLNNQAPIYNSNELIK